VKENAIDDVDECCSVVERADRQGQPGKSAGLQFLHQPLDLSFLRRRRVQQANVLVDKDAERRIQGEVGRKARDAEAIHEHLGVLVEGVRLRVVAQLVTEVRSEFSNERQAQALLIGAGGGQHQGLLEGVRLTGARAGDDQTQGMVGVDNRVSRLLPQPTDLTERRSIHSRESIDAQWQEVIAGRCGMHDEQSEMVIVEWTLKSGHEQEFLDFREPIQPSTPGFLGEQLYRAEIDGDRETIMYVNIGRWRSRADFYAEVPGVTEGSAPKPQDFEAAPRRRIWVRPVGSLDNGASGTGRPGSIFPPITMN
jgi:hypothetical protein